LEHKSNYTISESDLIKGCIAGDRRMQEELYHRFSPKMYAVCLRYASHVEDAQDLLQEGFIKVYRNLHHFRAEGSFEGWIRRVFVNTSIEHFRKKSTKLAMVTEKKESTIFKRYAKILHPVTWQRILNIRFLTSKYRLPRKRGPI
jgi:RNA polymerase sigma-70 factor (ECF subfamily)